MGERLYSEREINAIIKRAAALQQESVEDRGAGSTMGQIQVAAAELGIDPALVVQAADELQQGQKSAGFSWTGVSSQAKCHRVVSGTLSDEDLPALAETIQSMTNRTGFPRTLGNRFEWSSTQPDNLQIALTSANGNTTIDINWNFAQWIGLIFILPLVFGLAIGAGLFAELGPVIGLCLLLAIEVGAYSMARSGYAKLSENKKKSASDMADTLQRFVGRRESLRQQAPVTQIESASSTIPQTLIG